MPEHSIDSQLTNEQLGAMATKNGDPICGKMLQMGMIDQFGELTKWCQAQGHTPLDLQKAVYRSAILNMLPFKAPEVSQLDYMKGCVRTFVDQLSYISGRL